MIKNDPQISKKTRPKIEIRPKRDKIIEIKFEVRF